MTVGLSTDKGPLLRLKVFGAVAAASWAGEDVLPRGRKAQAILAYLAMCEDATVPRQRLADLLWSRRWPAQARASLRQSLLELKYSLGKLRPELLTIEKDRVSLQAAKVWIDGVSFGQGAAPRTLAPQASKFLETLRGLDPAFDQWIEEQSLALLAQPDTSRPLTDIDCGLPRPLPSGRRLKLVVTPFADLSADSNVAHLPPALTREVIAALGRFRWFTVSAGTLDESLSADYRVEGSVLAHGDACHVTVRLVDCRASGRIIWRYSSRLEREALQEFPASVATRMVERIDPEILSIEIRQAATKPSVDCTAYECLLRAIPLVYSFERENWPLSRTLLEQAIMKDPQIGRAYAIAAVARSTALSEGWVEATEAEFSTLSACATRAIECDPHDSMSLALSAHALLRLKRDFDNAMPMYERALQLNPSCCFAWAYSAVAHGYLGETKEGMRRLSRARDLAANDSIGSFLECFSMPIFYCGGNWVGTIALGKRLAARTVGVNNNNKLLVAALCQTGNVTEARQYHRQIVRTNVNFSWSNFIAAYPFGREADRLSLAAAVTGAGLNDGAPMNRITPAVLGKPGKATVARERQVC